MDSKTLRKVRHWIVENYGQDMINLINEVAPLAFEQPEELKALLSTYFDPSKELVEEILDSDEVDDFQAMINGVLNISTKSDNEENVKTPEQLMEEAGYILYPECLTEADIQSFRHYYYRSEEDGPLEKYIGGSPEERKGEELCTFDGDRLDRCRVWFAVKKNVAEIRREDFTNPQREDEYGTSVISIQFARRDGTLSIKNRYNHTVANPDSTFENDLDEIIPGLTKAFEESFDIQFNVGQFDESQPLKNLDIDNFVKAKNPREKDGEDNEKLYKLNHQLNDIYYCDNNIIIKDGKVIEDKTTMPPEQKRIIEYFVFDFVNKTVATYDTTINDSFVDTLKPIKNMQTQRGKIIITKDVKGENGEYEQVVLEVNDSNQITSVTHNNLEECGDDYLSYVNNVEKLNMPKLRKCGHNFLAFNSELTELNLESLEECGNAFLSNSKKIKKVELSKLRRCGDDFLYSAIKLQEISLISLEESGDHFLSEARSLNELYLPNWRKTGKDTLCYNRRIDTLYAPKLEECGSYFFETNDTMTEIDLPSLRIAGNNFFRCNSCLKKVNMPLLEETGDGFLYWNRNLEELCLPNWRKTGKDTLCYNEILKKLHAPKLEETGEYFLYLNKGLEELCLPNWIKADDYTLTNCKIKKLIAPKLKECGDCFCKANNDMSEFDLSSLEIIGENFLCYNECMTEINLPKTVVCGINFFKENTIVSKVNMPCLEHLVDGFMHWNTQLEELSLESAKVLSGHILANNKTIKRFYAPLVRTLGEKAKITGNSAINKKISQCVSKGIPIDIQIKKGSNQKTNSKKGLRNLIKKIISRFSKKAETKDNTDDGVGPSDL